MDDVAQITNLCKTFKSPAITAIDGLTLSLPKGKVIGLVGPDGAGKHYQIPFGALYNRDFPNILAAGRIISTTT